MSDAPSGAAAIVARISQARAAREIAAELERRTAAFEQLSQESRADVLAGLQRTLRRWARFVASGAMPPERDFDPLREWTRARAADGIRLEDLLRAFGLAHQLGWQLLRSHARAEETEVLLDLVAPLARYVDRVCAIVTETYLAEREMLVAEEERRARTLLDRLCASAPLDSSTGELAERLGVPIADAYTPFAVTMPGRPSHAHAALAARLRRAGWRLTVTHGDCVLGLASSPPHAAELGVGPEAALVLGEPTPREDLQAEREDVLSLAEYARRARRHGSLRTDEHLLEILLQRSPRLVGRLRTRLLDALGGDEHAELARTLRTLVDCRLDRKSASAALHIHR